MIPREQTTDSLLNGASFREHLKPSDIEKIRKYELDLASPKIIAYCAHLISELMDCSNGGTKFQAEINILRHVASSLQSGDTPLRRGL